MSAVFISHDLLKRMRKRTGTRNLAMIEILVNFCFEFPEEKQDQGS